MEIAKFFLVKNVSLQLITESQGDDDCIGREEHNKKKKRKRPSSLVATFPFVIKHTFAACQKWLLWEHCSLL